MVKRKDEELVGEPAIHAEEIYRDICYDCEQNLPDYKVSSWRITDRPVCKECIVPYVFAPFVFTIVKLEK